MSLRFLAFSLFLSGCALLPLDSPKIPHPSSHAEPALRAPGREAVGVIHVHSVYSDGTGTVEEIARTADRQGLDFLILTDHNTLKPRAEGKEVRTGRTRVMIGEEISTAGGHFLALRVPREIPAREEARWTIEQVSAAGGLGFIPHPLWKKSPWKGPVDEGFIGIEIYNAADGASSKKFPLLPGFWTVMAGSDFSVAQWLARPARALEFWDRMLAEGRRVVGIGGADAHGLRWMGFRLASYSAVFKLVRNHVLIDGDLTESAVYEALEKGHLFVAHDIIADASGFQFLAVREEAVVAVMGDQVRGPKGLKLAVYLPSPGEILLLRDGREAARVFGQRLELGFPEPGAYRVEARRKGRPWIYSNPIYVLE